MSTTFRTKVEQGKPERLGEGKTPSVQSVVQVEVPYTDYAKEHNHPYTVDHFELGKYWAENEGTFEKEVSLIEDYIQKKINSGEIANDVKTVKKELKKMEKLINIKDESRAVIKIGTLAAYIKFLNEGSNIKKDFAKYGNN